MLENSGTEKEIGRFTELLLDTLMAMAFTVGGAAFSATVSSFVGAIVGTRSKLLWLHRADGKLEAGMVLRAGELQLHSVRGSNGAHVLNRMREAQVEARRKDRATAAWNLGVEILADSAVITGILQERQTVWPTADARQPSKPVPIGQSVAGAADAQIAFEKRFMNMLYEMADETESIELANALFNSVQSVAMTEDQWKETKSRYLGLFTTFVWLQYIGDPKNIAWGVMKWQIVNMKGNPLIYTGGMLTDFAGSLHIAHPKLVEHMVKTIIYVKADETYSPSRGLTFNESIAVNRLEPSLTVWEHFVKRKNILFPTQAGVVPDKSGRRAGLGRQAYAELVGLYLIPSLERVHAMEKDFQKVMDPSLPR
jgi:hypothetical protein